MLRTDFLEILYFKFVADQLTTKVLDTLHRFAGFTVIVNESPSNSMSYDRFHVDIFKTQVNGVTESHRFLTTFDHSG